MEGGLALMCFRMLFWVCSLTLVLSQDTSEPSATIKILPEYTEQPREGDSVTLDCEIHGSSIQLTDHVLWSRRSKLQEPQIFIVNENGLTSSTDNRFSVSPLQVINSTAALYSHKITIDPVRQSDQGIYQCFVYGNIHVHVVFTQSAEITLFVYHLDEFPVCFPDGPATVTIGSSLSCKTLSDTRIPIVSEMGMPNATTDGWVTSTTNGGGSPGQELNKTVTSSEHGIAFNCFSLSAYSATALACKIGPLTVTVVPVSTKTPSTHKPTNELTNTTPLTVQPSTSKIQNCSSYIAVFIISIVIYLITIILIFLCCQYDPRRWQQLRGMLRRSSTPRQGNDQCDNKPEVDYEVPPPEPEPGTATPGTMASPPETAKHVYHNVMTEPTCTSSSKQSEDSYMELNPQERKPAEYSELKL